jgi:polyisoprenoid-binding protein YceI
MRIPPGREQGAIDVHEARRGTKNKPLKWSWVSRQAGPPGERGGWTVGCRGLTLAVRTTPLHSFLKENDAMGRALTAVVVLGLAAGLCQAGDTKFNLDGDNTKITFIGTKPGGKHEGGFKKVTGTVTYNGTDPTTLVFSVDIDMTSTYTDTEKLTNHLKSADFFDVKTNPKAKFVSSKVEKKGDGYTVTGKLTLNGKTKELSFPATIDVGAQKLNVTSNFTINRHDWNISYGKGQINDNVSLKVNITAK